MRFLFIIIKGTEHSSLSNLRVKCAAREGGVLVSSTATIAARVVKEERIYVTFVVGNLIANERGFWFARRPSLLFGNFECKNI